MELKRLLSDGLTYESSIGGVVGGTAVAEKRMAVRAIVRLERC